MSGIRIFQEGQWNGRVNVDLDMNRYHLLVVCSFVRVRLLAAAVCGCNTMLLWEKALTLSRQFAWKTTTGLKTRVKGSHGTRLDRKKA